MNQPLNKIAITLMLISSLTIPLTAHAELIAQENSAEANNVRIIFTNGTDTGLVQVSECEACPLNLKIDEQTRFFHNGKEIKRRQVNSLLGKPATVIYSKDGTQAHRVRW